MDSLKQKKAGSVTHTCFLGVMFGLAFMVTFFLLIIFSPIADYILRELLGCGFIPDILECGGVLPVFLGLILLAFTFVVLYLVGAVVFQARNDHWPWERI